MHPGHQAGAVLYVTTRLPGLHLYLAAQVQLLTNPSGLTSYFDITRPNNFIYTTNYPTPDTFTKTTVIMGDIFDPGEGMPKTLREVQVHQVHCSLSIQSPFSLPQKKDESVHSTSDHMF
jgi:hypothetical protein